MARPREFDEAKAVGAAAGVFRRQGYAATSVDDLVRATGVHRASLYGAFGSKYGLFLRVLESVQQQPVSDEVLDVYLVALGELAAHDEPMRVRLATGLRRHELSAVELGVRLLSRAGLSVHTEGREVP